MVVVGRYCCKTDVVSCVWLVWTPKINLLMEIGSLLSAPHVNWTIHLMPYCTSYAVLYILRPTVHLMPYCTSYAVLYILRPTVHLMPYCTSYAVLYILRPTVHLTSYCTSLGEHCMYPPSTILYLARGRHIVCVLCGGAQFSCWVSSCIDSNRIFIVWMLLNSLPHTVL
jgi:hypothetical protein